MAEAAEAAEDPGEQERRPTAELLPDIEREAVTRGNLRNADELRTRGCLVEELRSAAAAMLRGGQDCAAYLRTKADVALASLSERNACIAALAETLAQHPAFIAGLTEHHVAQIRGLESEVGALTSELSGSAVDAVTRLAASVSKLRGDGPKLMVFKKLYTALDENSRGNPTLLRHVVNMNVTEHVDLDKFAHCAEVQEIELKVLKAALKQRYEE